MAMCSNRCFLTAACLPAWIWLWTACLAEGATRDAARLVSEGIAKHRQGDFVAAEQAFSQAAQALPDDPRITFDRACALASQGKYAEAESLFATAKLARNPKISAGSLYNLGCLSARQAREKFGEQPEAAEPGVRAEGLKFVDQAVGYYRDCLAIDPQHAEARHNLELLRLWIKHMQEIWKQRDRDQRRKEMGLLEFLQMIVQAQTSLRGETLALSTEDDSPRRRQAASLLAQSQRELAEEMPVLNQKLVEAATQPPAGHSLGATSPGATLPAAPPNQPSQPDPHIEQAVAALSALVQQSQSAMSRAAADLASNQLTSAEASQAQALTPLDELYRVIAPFEHILQQSIRVEESLLESTRRLTDSSPDAGDVQQRARELPGDQRRVAGWIDVLPAKAQQASDLLKSQPVVAGPPPAPPAAGTAPAPDPAAQREAQLTAYAKAVELAPQAKSAADSAAAALDKQTWPEAISQEEETVRILHEIAAQLPKQPGQDSPPDPSSGKNQDQQQNQPNPGQDSQPTPQPQDQQKNPQSDANKSGKQDSKSGEPDRARQSAESLLRMVRERERDYREQQQRRAAILGGVKVDKDW